MNKLTKGSLATGAGLVLLLGGTGTFMSWNDSGTAAGDDMVAGHLDITGTTTAGKWTSNISGEILAADLATYEVVPGETLTYSNDLQIDALGDNLTATVGLTGGSITAASATSGSAQEAANIALAAELDETTALTATGTTLTATGTPATYSIDEGVGTVTVSAKIAFPFDTSTNDSEDGQVDLSGMTIELAQTAPVAQ